MKGSIVNIVRHTHSYNKYQWICSNHVCLFILKYILKKILRKERARMCMCVSKCVIYMNLYEEKGAFSRIYLHTLTKKQHTYTLFIKYYFNKILNEECNRRALAHSLFLIICMQLCAHALTLLSLFSFFLYFCFFSKLVLFYNYCKKIESLITCKGLSWPNNIWFFLDFKFNAVNLE